MGGREWYIDLVFGVRYTVKLLDWKPFARHPPNRVSLMCIDAHLAERSSRVLEEEQERTRREAGIDAKFKYFYNFPRFSFFPLSFFKYVDDCVTGRGSLTFKITHRRSAVSHRSKGPAALPSSFYWVPIPFREIWGKKGTRISKMEGSCRIDRFSRPEMWRGSLRYISRRRSLYLDNCLFSIGLIYYFDTCNSIVEIL